MSELAARISALPADRLKLLLRRLADGKPRPDVIRRQPGARTRYPLSFSQERLWFLCRLSPTSTAYNNPIPARIVASSPLDVAVLERCLTEVVRRHEALRTTFTWVDDEAVQVIQPPAPVRIAFKDLRALPPADRDSEGLRIAKEEGCHAFDLVTGPLLRVTLVRTDDCSYVLLLTPHHLICDGWSNGILIRELTLLYRAFSAGRPSPLPEPTVRYVDYALWQRERLSGAHLDKLMAYWTRQLGGHLPVLALPTDRARTITHDPPGDVVSRFVAPDVTRRLRALAAARQATLFETLLSGFYVLLHRYTQQTDLIVGTPVANRTRPEIEDIVGLFLNTLCVRVGLGDNPRFIDLVQRVQKVSREAFEHQELPFERLVQTLCTQRNLRHSPLFQVMFILQNAHLQPDQKDVVIRPLKLSYGAASFDLTLNVEEQEDGLRLAAEFRSDLFDALFIEEMLAGYERLLIGILEAPDRPIADHALPATRVAEAPDSRPVHGAATLEPQGDPVGVPRDAIEQRLASIWEELLDVQPIAVTEDFFELGGHSLLAVRLMSRIEAAFGQSLPLALLFEEGTIERLAIRLRRGQAGFSTAPLVPIQTAGDGPAVFFVHPAGGNVLCYYGLGRALAGSCRLYAFQTPPYCQEELALEEVAARYVDALLVEQPHGPYFLGGWSLGATVAHEMARQLERLGHRVGLVAILDQPAPAPAGPTPPGVDEDARELANLVNMAAAYAGKASEISDATLETMDSQERRRTVWEAFMRAGLVAPDTGLAAFSMYLEVHRRQMRSLRHYGGGTIASRTVLFRCAEPLATDVALADGTTDLRPDLGWADRTTGRFAIEHVPGTHQSMVSPPHVEALAARLAVHVGEALAVGPAVAA